MGPCSRLGADGARQLLEKVLARTLAGQQRTKKLAQTLTGQQRTEDLAQTLAGQQRASCCRLGWRRV